MIVNEGNLKEVEEKVDHFMGILSGEKRPTFDEVFMGIAYNWGARSTCLRRHVGAVLAKDSQQLTAGYNGAPACLPVTLWPYPFRHNFPASRSGKKSARYRHPEKTRSEKSPGPA